MADIGVDPWAWSSTAGSNNPTGSTVIGAGLDDNLRAIQAGAKASLESLSTVAGTNTITATCVGLTAYVAGQRLVFTPANTNTGATTLNVTSLGAKNVFWVGAACVGGEIRANIPVEVEYDGTQFHIIANGFNAPFLDTHPIVEGSTDSTKKVRIEADGLTTATTRVWTAADLDIAVGKQPTRQVLTSGTAATYTTPTGATRINVRMVGGGGGGAGSGAGGNGTASTWSGGSLSAGLGVGGASGSAGGTGGASSNGDINLAGGSGTGSVAVPNRIDVGGTGGNSAFGGAGGGGSGSTGPTAGQAGAANTGGGGGGGGCTSTGTPGSGGGAGGYCEKLITAPSATYTYTVGASGSAGSSGAQIAAGGAGGTGIIIVDEYYN